MSSIGHLYLYLFVIGEFDFRFGEAHIFAIGALRLFHEAINTCLGYFKIGLKIGTLATSNPPRALILHCVYLLVVSLFDRLFHRRKGFLRLCSRP